MPDILVGDRFYFNNYTREKRIKNGTYIHPHILN